ncbi:PD-(D/E)XK nuclease family protein [Nitrospirota bacterium]
MPPPEPRLSPARSRDSEIETMARHIKQRHLSGSNRDLEDTLIVFPDLKTYASTIRRVLKRYGVPLNQGSISQYIYKQEAWGDLMSMIRSVADGFPRLEFSRFLMSPYFRKIPPDVRLKAPVAALSSGMVKGRRAWQKALDTESARWVFRTLEPLMELNRPSSTYESFIKVLRDIIEAFVFHPEEGGPGDAARILERLSPCGAITGRHITLTVFADTLESILGPSEADEGNHGVEAASILDVRGLEPEVLYMGGLKDGDIPSKPEIDLLLPDSVRRQMGLVDVTRYMDLQEKIFTRLRMSAKELYLSYPSTEEDKVFLPSAFLSGMSHSPFSVSGHYCKEESMTAWGGDSLSPRLREITLPGPYEKERTLRVTEIDAYRRCPRRFAIERVMGMNPTEITEYEMEPTTLGSIAHRVMENMITGHPGSLVEFRQQAEEAINAALAEYDTDRFFSELIRKSLITILPEIHELESAISQEGFRVRDKEKLLEGQPLTGVSIKGKADRIDMNSNGRASIIDYKTGQASISAQALESRGENLQLFLYAALLRDMGIETERVGIYSLKDIKVKWVPGKRDLQRGVDMSHCIKTALAYLELTAKEMREGRFPARPISTNICNSCNEVPFCPYFQSTPDTGVNNA